MAGWHLKHGSWWMVQWSVDGWVSLGVHLDCRHRYRADGQCYGPYVDVHLGCVIISLGHHPQFSGELEKSVSVSRGGL